MRRSVAWAEGANSPAMGTGGVVVVVVVVVVGTAWPYPSTPPRDPPRRGAALSAYQRAGGRVVWVHGTGLGLIGQYDAL